MIIDRDMNNLHTLVGSVMQANENAPRGLVGKLGIVREKGPYGVVLYIQGEGDEIVLHWPQVDYIGQAEIIPNRKESTETDE